MRSTTLDNEVFKIKQLVRDGKRADGRKLDEMREITIEKGMAENSEGSAIVNLGDTRVIAGLKMSVGTPYPDSPAEGNLSIGAEALPLAHSEYESGRPSDDEVELARVVDRGIRESKSIDFDQLCIVEGEAVWTGFMDFYALNGDGNLFDAGCIAALVGFLNSRIPKLDEEHNIIKGEYSGSLKMKQIPILTTFVKIGNKILLDPTFLEEKAAEARYSVATTESGTIVAMQKGVGGSFTLDEVNYMLDTAFKVGDKVREIVKKA
jgi:exosome complex component RRP42